MTDLGSALFMIALPDTIMLAPAWGTANTAQSRGTQPLPAWRALEMGILAAVQTGGTQGTSP